MKIVKLALLIGCFSQMAFAGPLLICDQTVNTHIDKKTKQLKTFTAAYWKIATADVLSLPPALQKKGFVVGDFHFNNVGLVYDFTTHKAGLQINDFDDAGQNALIIDFLKYSTYLQKLNKEISQKQMLESYLEGLQLKRAAPPDEILNLENRNQFEFSKDYMKYIQNRREEFVAFNKATLTPQQNAVIQQLRELKLLRQLTGLDFMTQVNDSGSSMNEIRYEFIGNDANGAVGVIEFKNMKCSASGDPKAQDLQANFAWVQKFYAQHFSASEISHQFVFPINNKDFFLVREKKNNALKKLSIEKFAVEKLQNYANFYANFLGQIHAPSADASYINAISENRELLLEHAKTISKLFKAKVAD